MKTTEDVVARLRAEYLEMPGLRLRPEQVQRLCGIEHRLCRAVLDSLVEAKFLSVSPDGHYGRRTTGRHPLPAKAGLSIVRGSAPA
jgi:hypothetical protein